VVLGRGAAPDGPLCRPARAPGAVRRLAGQPVRPGHLAVPRPPWAPDDSAELAANASPEPERLRLSQAVFEAQQGLWPVAEQACWRSARGVVDVYGLVFAPDGEEEVFRRESQLVADVLRQRFDAEGRVLQLLNHPATATTRPWATPENLARAVKLLAARMDREHDLLVVYLTSHGAQNFQLAASLDPLEVAPIDRPCCAACSTRPASATA
jgi:hypothetical protein